jgi:tetratricopeptide (TPR) repeat protein
VEQEVGGSSPPNCTRGIRLPRRAMALDPENIEAMVWLATVDVSLGTGTMTDDWSTRFAASEATLTEVLSLAPNHAVAHLMQGLVQMFTKRTARGIAECEQALALERNSAVAHGFIGYAKVLLGRAEETEAHINEALRLSPRDTDLFRNPTVAAQRRIENQPQAARQISAPAAAWISATICASERPAR